MINKWASAVSYIRFLIWYGRHGLHGYADWKRPKSAESNWYDPERCTYNRQAFSENVIEIDGQANLISCDNKEATLALVELIKKHQRFGRRHDNPDGVDEFIYSMY